MEKDYNNKMIELNEIIQNKKNMEKNFNDEMRELNKIIKKNEDEIKKLKENMKDEWKRRRMRYIQYEFKKFSNIDLFTKKEQQEEEEEKQVPDLNVIIERIKQKIKKI